MRHIPCGLLLVLYQSQSAFAASAAAAAAVSSVASSVATVETFCVPDLFSLVKKL